MPVKIGSLCVIVLLSLVSLPGQAHRMLLQQEGEKICAVYDDGTTASLARLYAYNASDVLVDQGFSDEAGCWVLSDDAAVYVVATDGLGHRAVLELGTETGEINRWVRSVVGVFVLLGLGFGLPRVLSRRSRLSAGGKDG